MTRLEDTLEIGATPERLWSVLIDLPGWATWNTLRATAPEGLAAGRPIQLVLRVGRLQIPVRATLTCVSPAVAISWMGGVPGLFTATHGFDLSPTQRGGTLVRHHETFGGLLHRPLLAILGERQRRIYRAVNEGLARAATRG